MKNEIDHRVLLDAYEEIQKHGKAEQGKHSLFGVTAYTDHDGYRVFFEAHNVKLTLEFHNTYHVEYDARKDFDQFLKRVEEISKGYHSPGHDK